MGSITILGLECGGERIPERALALIRDAATIVVSSASGHAVSLLADLGVKPLALADLGVGQEAPSAEVASALVQCATRGDLVFVSAGYPLMRGGLLTELLAHANAPVALVPAFSRIHAMLMALDVDMTAGLTIADAHSFIPTPTERSSHLIVTGVSDSAIAQIFSDRLAKWYPLDHIVVIAAGGDDVFDLAMTTVGKLRDIEVPKDASVFVPPALESAYAGFEGFVQTIARLRAPGGCPWDRAQSHMSLRRTMIEEAYEAVAAIEAGDMDALCEELGDVLLQVVLHGQIAAEAGGFTIEDVVRGIAAKIERRHPHVFADSPCVSASDTIERWDELKREELGGDRALAGIPASLPALMWAQKISRRAAGVGFEWATIDDVWEQVHEELAEAQAAKAGTTHAAEEIGDILFTVVNVARKQGIDAEEALRSACHKFIRRFERMEDVARDEGHELRAVDIAQWERLWRDVKTREVHDR